MLDVRAEEAVWTLEFGDPAWAVREKLTVTESAWTALIATAQVSRYREPHIFGC